jgi:hypothetical protein
MIRILREQIKHRLLALIRVNTVDLKLLQSIKYSYVKFQPGRRQNVSESW